MALDSGVPTPPDLTNRGVPDQFDADEVDANDLDLRSEEFETIATGYVDWGEAELSDLVWDVEMFGQVPTGEEDRS